MKYLSLLVAAMIIFGCAKENKTQQLGQRFFDTYSERKEIDKMLSFYSNQFEYENVNFESATNDAKFLYEELYGWKDTAFKYNSEKTIQVEEILTSDSSIVAKGTTMPYTYNGKQVDGTRFVIWLELDQNLKIKKQTDWFDYPMAEIIEAFYLKNSMKIE
ncbi:MAG TPA: hypothetical protein VKY36_05210 [Moheibacter sp.]|nr:hypothetical protein [Moheibacter sp.]